MDWRSDHRRIGYHGISAGTWHGIDFAYPLEESQKPLFRLLGTPAADKRHALFDGGHVAPQQETMREVLAWFDRYLGPVALTR